MSAVVGTILAAGASTRLGRPKQLVAVEGMPLVTRAVRALFGAGLSRVAVVVSPDAEAVADVAERAGAVVLANPWADEGMAASIRVAASWASDLRAAGLLLTTTDQPALDAAHVQSLMSAFTRTLERVASGYAGVSGVPAVFPASDMPLLGRLRGDIGARHLLRSNNVVTVVPWAAGSFDVDTEHDVVRMCATR